MKKELVTPFSSRMRISDAINELAEMAEGAAFEGEVYTLSEKRKLEGISASATANRDDSLNADKVHTHTTAQVTGLDSALETKVDKVAGKGLSDENYTLAEKTKLSGIATGSTKNRADSENADKVHTHTVADVTGLNAIIEGLEARLTALETAGG